MNNFTNKEIQEIQDKTTKKLIKYINNFISKEKPLKSIEFYYPDFDERKTMIAFNVWISTDYRTEWDKSFIEHMLEDKSHELSDLEKDILIERNKSHMSLFEVLEVSGEFLQVKDLITQENSTIWDPELINMLKVGSIIFARIGKVIKYKAFIGNISFLPKSAKDYFLSEVFLNYNFFRIKNSEMTMEEFLKKYSVRLFKIYTKSVYEVMEGEEDTTSILYDELEAFESYLDLKFDRSIVRKHVTNLITIYEYFLMENDLSLSDLDKVELDEILNLAIKENLIYNQSQLSSYISSLKLYLGYLKSQFPEYKKAYKEILKISKNRFLYSHAMKDAKAIFKIDENISSKIGDLLNDNAYIFIMDYEKFLLYTMSNPIELTAKKKHISRKYLKHLNGLIENSEAIEKKAPNQKDFPILNLFYNISLDLELVKIDGDVLTISRKSTNFLKLSDEEKITLFVEYIYEEALEDPKYDIFAILKPLKKNTFYAYEEILPRDMKTSKPLLNLFKYFKALGLVRILDKPYLGIEVSDLGSLIFKVLKNEDYVQEDMGQIIDINSYIKGR